MPPAKTKIRKVSASGEYTSANRILRELAKHTASARKRIMDIVSEYDFDAVDEEPAGDEVA